jgi:signal-transduction protein with cAMP-binding, CBS, and nucleotidyltransferase domain
METKNHSRAENDEKVEAKPVREIVEPVTPVPHKVSVRTALKEMQVKDADSSLVTNESGKLLGSVSKEQMNRKVGGLGHDPKTFAVEPQVEKPAACCFEDQTIGEAEKVMLDAEVDEVPVVTQEELLLGKTTLGAIAQKKDAEKGKDRKRLKVKSRK